VTRSRGADSLLNEYLGETVRIQFPSGDQSPFLSASQGIFFGKRLPVSDSIICFGRIANCELQIANFKLKTLGNWRLVRYFFLANLLEAVTMDLPTILHN
jgi:hypothetical protein